jgi:phage regulator Rha-like protein
MSKSAKSMIVSDEAVINKIYLIRGQKVMLDSDLAKLYGIETRNLNKAIKRNLPRFPEDFMFQLTKEEHESLMFQIGTSKIGRGGTRKLPYVFTEQGVAMLSSVLNSETAVQVNIQIIRIYTKMREMLSTHKDILLKLEQLERQAFENADDIQVIFEYLKELLIPAEQKNRTMIGFRRNDEN